MKTFRSILCILLCLGMLLAAAGCSSSGNGYRIVDEYSGEGSYYIAFRKGDHLREYVSAALQELAAGNTLRAASISWFGENLVSVRGDDDALEPLREELPQRSVTVGIDVTNMPMSYLVGGGYVGFDVDLIGYICNYLGWTVSFYPIDIGNAEVELNAGNIDIAMAVSEADLSENFDYSPAYLNSQYVLVARAGSHIRRRSGLKGKVLGVTVTDQDVLYQDEDFVNSLGSVIYQTNTDGLFQALMKGEVDGILVSSVVAAYYMK